MNCLIIDDLHPILIDLFHQKGISTSYKPDINRTEFEKLLPNYDILIVRSKFNIDQSVIDKATKLKIIGRCGAGLDNIHVEYAENRQIKVFSANEGNQESVAEHTTGLILSLLHNINKGHREVGKFIWDREGNRGNELNSKTVGIIGYGYMGKAVAQKLKIFGCKILAYDKYLTGFSDENVKESTLDQIFAHADILTLHIPLKEDTKNLVNTSFINGFSKPFYLVNTSRGKIASNTAVLSALQNGKILGAALDVLENENINSLSEEEKATLISLHSLDNVIITPHIAGWSVESYKKLSEILASKILTSISQF